jgi:hypothetical protein
MNVNHRIASLYMCIIYSGALLYCKCLTRMVSYLLVVHLHATLLMLRYYMTQYYIVYVVVYT